MLHLCLPVLDGHKLTRRCLDQLDEVTLSPSGLHVVVLDNESDPPYEKADIGKHPYEVTVLRNQKNVGYYAALWQLQRAIPHTIGDLFGLMHNDLFICEVGWDERLRGVFIADSELALVGVAGSDELDDRGGRGGGTMCNFRGTPGRGQLQEHTGKRVHGLHPACVLDSMFMVMRASIVPMLGQPDPDIPLGHFIDKLWPMRLAMKGWHVAVLGLEVDHMGGMSMNGRYHEHAKRWCEEQGLAEQNVTALYVESERRFLNEVRAAGMLPSAMDGWRLRPQVQR